MPQELRFEHGATRRDNVVGRSRIVARLRHRFEQRVTTVTGAAGYGKTTALALAVENNLLDPIGRDVSVALTPLDADPIRLLGAILGALGLEAAGDEATSLRRIVDATWSAAPEEVALIIDDAHHLNDSPGIAVLGQLLAELPANAHLVLSSRAPVDIPLARLRAHGQLGEITAGDLALDDDELAELRVRRDAADDFSLPRHAATADLRLAAGIDAGADFLWEEILSALDADRLTHLRRVAVVDELDDELVRAISDGSFDASTLLAGLPLIERRADGGYRMHAILREALLPRLQPGERRKALSIAADAERERLRLAEAIRLYHESGDNISALDTARQLTLAPVLMQSIRAVLDAKAVVDEIDPESPVALILEASSRFAGLERQIVPMFREVAAAARAVDDTALETLALYRVVQSELLDHDPGFEASRGRIDELCEHSEVARGAAAFVRSVSHQLDGYPLAAAAELDQLDQLGQPGGSVARAMRLCDLGRPEEVAIGLGPDALDGLPSGAGLLVALAMWWRGEADPEVAMQISEPTLVEVLRQGFTHPSVSTLGTFAVIAVAAGENERAARYIIHAREIAADGVGRSVESIVDIAEAALTAVIENDADAIALLVGDDGRGRATWPSRAQLFSLPLVYLARPDMRPMLDRMPFGPSFNVAVSAGHALVALRAGDPAPAGALPWSRPTLLRVHLLPHHLAELACGAIATGRDEAHAAIDAVPRSADHLARVASGSGPAAEVATRIIGSTPLPEPFRLHAQTLGPVMILRDGIEIDAPAFTKRPKVRELFGLLLERGRLTRPDAIGLLWPEHDDDKAASSLRTALSTLNDVLEPTRRRGEAAFHLHVDADSIAIDTRVTTDLAEFEALVDGARSDDEAGLPARALDGYQAAMSLYRGDYLEGVDASWIVLTRLRLRSLAVNATCRIAELTAAKGEPEQAARWATKARAFDPLNERAGRLFVAALDAAGDRSGARSAADELLATLADADVSASGATLRLVDRLR